MIGLLLGSLLVGSLLWYLGRDARVPTQPASGAEALPPGNGSIRVLPPGAYLVTITSDPSGATVTIEGERVGVTPLQVPVVGNRPVSYRVAVEDPALGPERYEPYEGTLDADRDASIAVWLDRR